MHTHNTMMGVSHTMPIKLGTVSTEHLGINSTFPCQTAVREILAIAIGNLLSKTDKDVDKCSWHY